MKKFLILLIAVSFAGIKYTQGQTRAKWKEMEDFHLVMAQTFHPAEEGKMEPIKTRSQEMLDKAIAWKDSKAPEGYDKAAVTKSLTELVEGAREINKLVKEKSKDDVIKTKLSALHNTFHEIMETCEKEDHQ